MGSLRPEKLRPMVNGKTERPPETLRAFDPDPFAIGLAIFTALAGGGAFLEARRQRQFVERQHRERFRTVWFNAKRALIFFGRAVDEFETYMLEDDYGGQIFRIGVVRLTVDTGRHHALRRLKGQAITTANVMSDTLDDLSEFLGPDYQQSVQVLLDELSKLVIPERYSEVIKAARRARDLYDQLLKEVGAREGFDKGS